MARNEKKRRENGEGSISQRKDGTWTGRIDIGTTKDGKRKVKAVYGKTEREVKAKLKEVRNSLIKEEVIDSKTITVRDYVSDWLITYKKNEVKPKTYDYIEMIFNNYIFPSIGDYQLHSVNSNDIQKMINKLTDADYAYSTIRKSFIYTNNIFDFARKRHDIKENPCELVVLPKAKEKAISDIVYYNANDIVQIKKFALEKYSTGKYKYRYGYAVILMLYTGLRAGEVCGLKWKNVDFENKTIYIDNNISIIKDRDKSSTKKTKLVEGSPKSRSSERKVPLADMAIEALEYFKKVSVGGVYVVTKENGKLLDHHVLDDTFYSIIEKACPKKRYGVHALRHTFASMLFKKGVDVKTVSEILGHKETGVTYNIYIHIIEDQKKKAISQLNDF